MNKDLPLVSIITPSYNQGKFIEDTILSVKNQDYPNIEHIIVDGSSTDNTLEIFKKYEGTYNMRWISEPDEGQSDAVNKGFRMAKGEIIGWLNSDDVYFMRDVISYVVEQFKNNPHIDVIYGDNIYVDRDFNFLGIRKMLWWSYDHTLRGIIPSQPSAFFRREVARKFQLNKDLNFVMDLEFWLKIGRECNVEHISKIIAADRLHESTKRSKLKDIGRKEALEVLKLYGANFNAGYYFSRNFVDFPLLVIWRLLGIFQLMMVDLNYTTIELKSKNKLILALKQFLFVSKEIKSRLKG